MAKLMAPNIRIDWYPEGHFQDIHNPTIDELNSGYNLSCAVVTGFTLNFTDSETENTTTIFDDFQSETISTYAYEANLQFFLAERNASEDASDNVKAFKSAERLFSNRENVKGYLGKRYGHKGTADYELGQHYTLFEVQADLPKVVSEEAAPILLDVNYVPQGFAYIHVPMVTYEWAGTPHASESIKKFDGVEVARNLVVNGDFEHGVQGWSSSGLTSVTASSGFNHQMWGGLGGRLLHARAAEGVQHPSISQNLPTPESGQWVAVSAYVASERETSVRTQLRASNPSRYLTQAWGSADFYPGRHIIDVHQVTDTHSHLTLQIQMDTRDTEGTTLPRFWADKIQVAFANSEQEALAQVAEYFDGDTPDEYL